MNSKHKILFLVICLTSQVHAGIKKQVLAPAAILAEYLDPFGHSATYLTEKALQEPGEEKMRSKLIAAQWLCAVRALIGLVGLYAGAARDQKRRIPLNERFSDHGIGVLGQQTGQFMYGVSPLILGIWQWISINKLLNNREFIAKLMRNREKSLGLTAEHMQHLNRNARTRLWSALASDFVVNRVLHCALKRKLSCNKLLLPGDERYFGQALLSRPLSALAHHAFFHSTHQSLESRIHEEIKRYKKNPLLYNAQQWVKDIIA